MATGAPQRPPIEIAPNSGLACFGHAGMPFGDMAEMSEAVASLQLATEQAQVFLDAVRRLGAPLDPAACKLAAPFLDGAGVALATGDPSDLPFAIVHLMSCDPASTAAPAAEGAMDAGAMAVSARAAYGAFQSAEGVLRERREECGL